MAGGGYFSFRDPLQIRRATRTIEYTLFHCHRKLQRGRLYD